MYAIIENEHIDELLATCRDWFQEPPKDYDFYDDVTKKERDRLYELGNRITRVIADHEKIVQDYSDRCEEENATDEEKKQKLEFKRLMDMPQEKLAKMFLESKYGAVLV